MKLAFLLGRIAFGGFFVYNGINHFKQREMLSRYAGAKRVPKPDVAVLLSGVLMLMGGGSILLGIKPKYGALAIITFLAGVSPVIHDFWNVQDPGQRMHDLVNFSKNLALLGAALSMIGVEEPWPASVPVAQPRRLRLAA